MSISDSSYVMYEGDIRTVIRSCGYARNIDAQEFVYHEGQMDESLYLIHSGRVAVQRRTHLGDVATLTVLGRDSLFGEVAILGDGRRTATVRTLEKTRFYVLDRARFEELRRRNPAMGQAIEKMLADTVRRLSDQLVEALYEDARVRLARRLVDLADLYGARPGNNVYIPLTQEMIGSMAGVKLRQTAKRLQEFEALGLIRLDRSKVYIENYERLRLKGRLGK